MTPYQMRRCYVINIGTHLNVIVLSKIFLLSNKKKFTPPILDVKV